MLSERTDIERLLAFAVAQDDYRAWSAARQDAVGGNQRIAGR